MVGSPRVLFIDAYDSFSNNIISLLETELGAKVSKVFIDSEIPDFASFVAPFDAIVCGPGPGNPAKGSDVGLFQQVWALEDASIVPTLGICLGFQSLALTFGGKVSQLPRPRHGLETEILSSSTSIFEGVPRLFAVQYHSLHATLGHDAQTARNLDSLWGASGECPQLVPLAWDTTYLNGEGATGNPAAILMAVQHQTKPFYGLQFHPESICSEELAKKVVSNWWKEAALWNKRRGRSLSLAPELYVPITKDLAAAETQSNGTSQTVTPSRTPSPVSTAPSSVMSSSHQLHFSCHDIGALTVPAICEVLGLTDHEVIILDSEMRQLRGLGEFSIIGIVDEKTTKVSYTIGQDKVTVSTGADSHQEALDSFGGSVFGYLKDFVDKRSISETNDSAFSGGLMGFITYEAGLETIGIHTPPLPDRPDICFAFVERSIVIDHIHQKIYIQSLRTENNHNADSWVSKTADLLASDTAMLARNSNPGTNEALQESCLCTFPSKEAYTRKIRECQDNIRAGESYELCLTDQTSINFTSEDGKLRSPWQRYSSQRTRNRAPFSAYLRLDSLTLLSTSPERFLCWSRPRISTVDSQPDVPEKITTCQFRPIKGTVKKRQELPSGEVKVVTLDEATAILSTPKERAENLMIVDLIRHDLHSVAGSGNVQCPALMVVEEYETVYQLVSVIEGRLRTPLLSSPRPQSLDGMSSGISADDDSESGFPHVRSLHRSGIDVLAAALPPGSMTGAPKRRACRLLRGIEREQRRSIDSGVVGYMCVTGKGDFSVVIRSAFRWDPPSATTPSTESVETWRIGAGGAVTDLSTEMGEWEEMLAKLQGTLGSFAPGAEAGLPQ